jgi:hypothetical protein
MSGSSARKTCAPGRNGTVLLVVHGEVVAALDGAREAQMELAEPDIAEDAADLLHGAIHPGHGILV